MKCVKCGYISFDHLSECKKCGANIASVRDTLGFSAAKPSISFMLGSLLKDYQPPAPAQEAASVAPAFDFGDETEIGGGFKLAIPESDVEIREGTVPNPEEGEEDFSLLDLSDEELELLIDKDRRMPSSEPGGPVGVLELETEKAPPEELSIAFDDVAPAEKPAAPSENEWLPKFDDDTLPGFETKAPQAEKPGLKMESAPIDRKEESPQDEFVIELSDKDLEALMLELDSSSVKDAAKDGDKAGPQVKEPKK